MDDANLSWVRLIHPVSAPISQRFGASPSLYQIYGLAGHEGVDYACSVGTQIVAAEDGVVWKAGSTNNPWGKRIILEHIHARMRSIYYTVYAHMSEVYVTPGTFIKGGQIIGKSGNTGNSTGPHLHFCVALPFENKGYKCPLPMGERWWHNPISCIVGPPDSTRGEVPEHYCGNPMFFIWYEV